jgi:hypothetical protein
MIGEEVIGGPRLARLKIVLKSPSSPSLRSGTFSREREKEGRACPCSNL